MKAMDVPQAAAWAGSARCSASEDESTLAPGARLLPALLREDFYRLYDVLRTLDDLVDDCHPEAPERIGALERWLAGGAPDSPEAQICAALRERRGLSLGALSEFCAGMRHDIARRAIESEADLEAYCQSISGSIGLMVASMIDIADGPGAAALAALGRAVQRVNILRDIDEDAARGRCYIPAAIIERFGPPLPGERSELLRDQIAKAETLLDAALAALRLPAAVRPGVLLTAARYRDVLRSIEREQCGIGRQLQAASANGDARSSEASALRWLTRPKTA